jgi:hypothetical protein
MSLPINALALLAAVLTSRLPGVGLFRRFLEQRQPLRSWGWDDLE